MSLGNEHRPEELASTPGGSVSVVLGQAESTLSPGVQHRYPLATAVLRQPIEGRKRKKVLAAIAAFHDEGQQPALSQIAERAQIEGGWKMTKALIRRLEQDGLLRVEWVSREQQQAAAREHRSMPRNRYEVVIG